MKTIEFQNPVASMRGSLNGRQNLVYAKNKNKAYYSPSGQTNYAQNYRTTFIGAKVARTNKNYFCVKTKTAATMSKPFVKSMAAMAASNAIYNMAVKNLTWLTQLQRILKAWKTVNPEITLRKMMIKPIYYALSDKSQVIGIEPPIGSSESTFVMENPFAFDTPWDDTNRIPNHILSKFWDQLSFDGDGTPPITFTIDGQLACAFEGWRFGAFVDDFAGNIFRLSIVNGYVRVGGTNGRYLLQGSTYMDSGGLIEQGNVYTTTDVPPTA